MPMAKQARLFLLAALCASASPFAAAQSDAQRAARHALLERDQQSEAFSLQLQQSQQKLNLSPGDRRAADALHLEQQHRMDALDQEQLRQLVRPLNYNEARMERDRRAQRFEFAAQPSWGPRLEPLPLNRWSPSAEPPPRDWTPTLP